MKITIDDDGVSRQPFRIQIDGKEYEAEFVEISLGCSEHDAPLCTLLRTTDGREIHMPGHIESITPPPDRED